jgi:ribose transport system permease protein
MSDRRATWWQRVGPLLGLAILCVALAIASPHFLTVDNLLNVLRQSAINAVLALGQLMVIITAGIDLSIGSIVGLAIVLLAKMLRADVPPALACLLTVGCGVAVGLVNGLLLTRLKLPHPFISTLGTMNVARGAALLIAGGVPISGMPAGFRSVLAG